MAIPVETTHVVLHGTTAGGIEEFDTGFWMVGVAPISDAAATVLADQLAALFVASDANDLPPIMLNADSTYTELRVYSHVGGGPVAAFVGVAALVVAGAATTWAPLQTCMVATLRTDSASRRGRGRMFLPANSGAIYQAAHRFENGTVDLVASGIADFFQAIDDDGAIGNVVVMSDAGSATQLVLNVTVDNRPDIQRRRANKLVASHVGAGAVTP
jgi:hypothetical protein